MAHFRRATVLDASILAELGRATFVDAFAADNRAEDMDAYVRGAFGEAQQRRELEDPSTIAFIAEQDGVAVGYTMLHAGEAPACVSGEHPIEIVRFYVTRTFHGRGIAQELMRLALEAAQDTGATVVWLGVWERNFRAVAFYRKSGFRVAGSHPFLLGSDLQTDLVMVRP